jgi:subtilisin-like proprotein convertase family protein
MKTSWISATFALACLMATGIASATATHPNVDYIYSTGPGLGLDIPDNDANGISSTISISDDFLISHMAILVSMDHTYIGDLIFTLTGPDGTSITLADRPGYPDASFGDDSNLSAHYPIIFGDLFPDVDAENLGRGCDGTDTIVGVDCTRQVSANDSMAAAFGGLSTLGDWTLTVSDNADFDTGSINGWSIAIQVPSAVPVPAGVWLLASGLFALAGARRKRAS